MFDVVRETGEVVHPNILSPRYAANLAEALTRKTGYVHKVDGFNFDYNEQQVQELLDQELLTKSIG